MSARRRARWAQALRRAAAVVAGVVPLGLSLGLGLEVTREMPACRVRCAASARLDRELERTAPRLVVVGNSMARRDVDPRALAQGLGLPPGRAAMLAMPGSSPGAWYAALAYRVYGAGYAPEWVVVVGASRSLWITAPTSGADVTATLGLAGTEDPVVAAVSGPGEGRWARAWWRADLRRRMWRAAAVDGLAALARPLLRATTGVVPDDEVEAAVTAGPPPGVANVFGGRLRTGDVGTAGTVEDGYLPHLAREVRAHGGRLVLARVPPMREENNAFLRANPGADDAIAAWAARAGVVFARMPDLVLPRAAYADPYHLTPAGAATYTEALVAAIASAEAPEGAPEP